MSSRRDASSDGEEQRALHPRYRRAFGCVTWIYMATLAFLAVASFGLMPVWLVLGWNVFSFLEGIAFFATLLILPAMFFGAALGLRTYRSSRREATLKRLPRAAKLALITATSGRRTLDPQRDGKTRRRGDPSLAS